MNEGKNDGTRPGDAERPQESGAATPGRGGTMSRQRKTAAVPLLRGGHGVAALPPPQIYRTRPHPMAVLLLHTDKQAGIALMADGDCAPQR